MLGQPALRPEPDPRAVEPIRVLEVELSQALDDVPSVDGAARRHRRALVLVRLHGEPIGQLDVALEDTGLAAACLTSAIWDRVGQAAAAHLRADGLPVPETLTQAGLQADEEPRCEAERRRFLLDAPFLTVIIPSRERPERLARCLDSLWTSAYPVDRFEVVVVDNDPDTQGTYRVVAEHAAQHPCRYLREDVRGSASARNTGIEAVSSELLVFTDDDVKVDRHWLTEIARAFLQGPDAACVSGLLVPLELETPAQVWFEQYGGFSRGFTRKVYDLERNRPRDNPLYPYTAGVFGTGNNMAFRRSVLREIGSFDPALGNGTPALGGVDSEALLRTVLTGHTVVYEPRALVHHQHRPDYAGLQKQIYAYGTGLTAYLLKTVMSNPHLLPDIVRRLPAGLRFALSPGSGKNADKQANYPRELTRLELRGMVYGPLAYARSRRMHGRHVAPRAMSVRSGPRGARTADPPSGRTL